MKKPITFIICLMTLLVIGCENKPDNNLKKDIAEVTQNSAATPLEVVNQRMAYFNEHNYEEFIKLYSKDVRVYTYPDKLMGKGSSRLGSIFRSDFEKKSISVKILNQITNGNYVINHEVVTNNGKEKKYVSIYEVRNGLITNVSFVREF